MQPSFGVNGEKQALEMQWYLRRVCQVFGNWWKNHTLPQHENKDNETHNNISLKLYKYRSFDNMTLAMGGKQSF